MVSPLLFRRRSVLAALASAAALGGGAGGYFLWRPRRHTVRRVISPQRIETIGATLFVDFGKVWFGNVVLRPNARNRGAAIVLCMGEKLNGDGRVDRQPFGSVRYYEARTTLDGDRYSPPLTPPDMRGMEDNKPAMPFRYVEIEGWHGSLPKSAVEFEMVVSERYAPRGRITFTGDSGTARQLNRLMALGEHTMAATSFMGVFVDGDRERLPYEADGYINQLGWYATAGDWTVPRRTIETLLKKPTWPSEWMVQLIFMVWADYQATGDRDFLGQVYDRIKLFSLEAFVDNTGLVTTFNKSLAEQFVHETRADYLQDIVDYPPSQRDGYDMRPYNTVVNAFVYQGLHLMASIADTLGRSAEAKAKRMAAEKLRNAIEHKLLDKRAGIFVDGEGSTHSAAHSTFFPLAFGLVPPERRDAAIRHLKDRIAAYDGGFPCSVYGAQYLLDSLFSHGCGDLALKLMLNGTVRSWMHMLDAYDATITHEAWDVAFKENIDWTHAWGSAFLNITQRFILGARMLAPRWERWTLRPDPAIGESISATIPTPHGTIGVEVDAPHRILAVKSPQGADFVPPSDGIWSVEHV